MRVRTRGIVAEFLPVVRVKLIMTEEVKAAFDAWRSQSGIATCYGYPLSHFNYQSKKWNHSCYYSARDAKKIKSFIAGIALSRLRRRK